MPPVNCPFSVRRLKICGSSDRKGPYVLSTQLLSVASNSDHAISKPVAAAQQGMHSNAGMPAAAQHHQPMGGPIGSAQRIIQQGQQMSPNAIAMQAATYYPRNNVPARTMANIARTPMGPVVNQAGQQGSNQGYPPMQMVPLQNCSSFPPTAVVKQFPQMYQQRANSPAQYGMPWKYNTPPPQDSKEKKNQAMKNNLNRQIESIEDEKNNALLDKNESVAVPLATSLSSITTATPTPVPDNSKVTLKVYERIFNSVAFTEEKPNTTKQNEPTNKKASFSSMTVTKKEENPITQQKKLVLKLPDKENQWKPLNPEGKKQYDREFLLQLQYQPMSLCKPNNLPNLDDIKDKARIQKLPEVNRKLLVIEPPSKKMQKRAKGHEKQNKIVLKYCYKENQWSPLNPEGKKQYDREFLLQLQSQPMSLDKPSNLPKLDVIKDKAHMQKLPEVYGDPVFIEPSSKKKTKKVKDPARPKILDPVNQPGELLKLHESPNPWKPLHKSDVKPDEKDKLKRNVLSLLNKLTPENFETLLKQIKSLQLDTEEKLDLVSHLIFEKAVYEPLFSGIYAELSKKLAWFKVQGSKISEPQIYFIKLLRGKCQDEFEKERNDEVKDEEKVIILEANDFDKSTKLRLEYEEQERKIRYRKLGNIRFIGELFKLGMIIGTTMHEYVKKLLFQSDEESLECLCRLLNTVGANLDSVEKPRNFKYHEMDMYLALMKVIVDKRSTSSRIRFMLQDILDMKKNNWIPRRKENTPKTINQIHQEAELENLEQQALLDEWKKSKREMEKDKKKRKTPNDAKHTTLESGENGSLSLDSGSNSGTKMASVSDETYGIERSCVTPEQPLASNFESKNNCSEASTPSSPESCPVQNISFPSALKMSPCTSKDVNNHPKTVQGVSRISDTRVPDIRGTINNHLNKKSTSTEESPIGVQKYNKGDIKRKTKLLMDEFLLSNNLEKAIKCSRVLISSNNVNTFFNEAIKQVFGESSQSRRSLGQLLSSLLKREIVTFDQYKKGFSSVLEIMNNYDRDIRVIWDYMGEILEPLIEDMETPFKFLKEVLKPCIPSEKAGMLVSFILHRAAESKDAVKIGEVWRDSGIQWTDIIGTDKDATEFIKKHKLQFTVSPKKANPRTPKTMEEIKKHLLSLLEKDVELKEVFNWINSNISMSDIDSAIFIRALVTAIHESCLSGSGTLWELNTCKLKSRLPLLSLYVSTNEKLQLQALYALQALMNQLGHPSGILRIIFDVLFDDDVISDETFEKWEQSDDPNEAEGRSVAVDSVKFFFTWLREPVEEVDEEVV